MERRRTEARAAEPVARFVPAAVSCTSLWRGAALCVVWPEGFMARELSRSLRYRRPRCS